MTTEFAWGSAVWHRRLAIAASMVPAGAATIADLGAGKCDLMRYLWGGSYKPYDKVPMEGVERLDLDREIPLTASDVIVCLGVLEYLKDPQASLTRLKATAPWLICSARRVPPDAPEDAAKQRANMLGIAEMRACIERAGWIVCDERVLGGDQHGFIEKVWLARRREE